MGLSLHILRFSPPNFILLALFSKNGYVSTHNPSRPDKNILLINILFTSWSTKFVKITRTSLFGSHGAAPPPPSLPSTNEC